MHNAKGHFVVDGAEWLLTEKSLFTTFGKKMDEVYSISALSSPRLTKTRVRTQPSIRVSRVIVTRVVVDVDYHALRLIRHHHPPVADLSQSTISLAAHLTLCKHGTSRSRQFSLRRYYRAAWNADVVWR